MKVGHNIARHASQLQRLLYVVFPSRERQMRTSRHQKAAPVYVWGKRDLRCLKTRPAYE